MIASRLQWGNGQQHKQNASAGLIEAILF